MSQLDQLLLANFFSDCGRGDLALSISMTITSTIAVVVLMPRVLWGYATPFANNELAIPDSDIVITLVAVLEPMGFWACCCDGSAKRGPLKPDA